MFEGPAEAAMTARFGAADSPNACLSCHQDRTVVWLAGAMTARKTAAP